MTKRILALFLVCILAIPILAFPVSATSSGLTEYENTVLDWLLDLYTLIKYDLGAGITSVNANLSSVIRYMQSYYNGLKSALETLDTNVSGYFDTLGENLTAHTDKLWNKLVDIKYDTHDIINLLKINISDLLTSIDNTCGYIYETLVNRFLEIFQNIEIKIDSLISGGDQKADSDDFRSDVDNAKSDLDEAGEVIDSATLPTIDDNFDETINTTISSGSKYFQLLKMFFRSDFFVGQILLMSFTLSTVAYVFFGKRG